MSSQITTSFVQQYHSNVVHLAQQKGSRLRPYVRQEMQKGKASFFDRIGAVDAVKRIARHQDTQINDTPHSRRMVTLNDYTSADLIDDVDKLRSLSDPTNAYAQAAKWAMGRAMDNELVAAALGDAKGGETGSTAVALGNGQRLASHTSGTLGGLNVYALRKAAYVLNLGDVDPDEPRHIAINAKMLDSLLAETAVTSSDYNTVKALVAGEVDTFMGFKFHRLERLIAPPVAFKFNTTTGLYDAAGTVVTLATSKSAFCWAGDGLLLSIGEDASTDIGPRRDKNNSIQVLTKMSIGATRMEETKVVEIITAA